jgi:hypothetical protein
LDLVELITLHLAANSGIDAKSLDSCFTTFTVLVHPMSQKLTRYKPEAPTDKTCALVHALPSSALSFAVGAKTISPILGLEEEEEKIVFQHHSHNVIASF